MRFKSVAHRRIYNQFITDHKITSPDKQAALFLLTASPRLWHRARANVQAGEILFDKIPLKDCSTDEYTLLCCARDICVGDKHITVYDLADATVVPESLFKLVVDAIVIARSGLGKATR